THPKNKTKNKRNAACLLVATTTTTTPSAAHGDTAQPNTCRTSLGAGIVKPVGARIDWASLLKRIYLQDVLACPCGGRRNVIADILDPSVVVAILVHLGLPPLPPPIARARS